MCTFTKKFAFQFLILQIVQLQFATDHEEHGNISLHCIRWGDNFHIIIAICKYNGFYTSTCTAKKRGSTNSLSGIYIPGFLLYGQAQVQALCQVG